MSDTANNSLFCWEQATKSNRLFQVTSVFADASVKPMLPPLYALFSAIDQICSGTREESVAQQRLAWWYEEILQTGPGQSSHPVLMELSQTGAAERLTADSFELLLNSAAERLEASPVTDISGLRRVCQQAGWPMVKMELEVSGCKIEINDGMAAVAQNVGLMALMRESHSNAGPDAWWWIPLNSMAKYGVSRGEIDPKSASGEIKPLLSELLSRFNESSVNSASESDISYNLNKISHLLIMNELYRRRISRWSRVSPSSVRKQIGQLRFSELLAAWNTARKISRRR